MSVVLFHTNVDPAAIVHAARRQLCESPYFFLKNVNCFVQGEVLTLHGRVPFWQLKQFAESIVSRVEGVRTVVNRIEVYDPEFPAAQRASGA